MKKSLSILALAALVLLGTAGTASAQVGYGGGNIIIGVYGGGGGGAAAPSTGGQVLGAATTTVGQGGSSGTTTTTTTGTTTTGTGTASNSCSAALLTSTMGIGRSNDVNQVKKLQEFLNKNLGTTIPVTGFFGNITLAAVKAFQLKYSADILTPSGITAPSGFVGKYTLLKINALAAVCV